MFTCEFFNYNGGKGKGEGKEYIIEICIYIIIVLFKKYDNFLAT